MAADLKPPSFWLQTCGDSLRPRPSLRGDEQVDVAIVGAGYTGLWTAYHLLRAQPSLRVAVVERHIAGWGASGRNGGWCSALFAASWSRLAAEHGADAALRLRRELERTVDDVGDWAVEHGIDIDYAKGGTLTLARSAPQLARLRRDVEADRAAGGEDTEWLGAAQADMRVHATDVRGAAFTPHCAAVQPAKLARGLARVVEGMGGRIYERTRALGFSPGVVRCHRGRLRADVVVRATEGYTRSLQGEERRIAPVWSLLVVTEPLPASVWDDIGWRNRETVSDGRHLIIYAQRTADDRIAFGGRGAPYLFGSRTHGRAGQARTFARLEEELAAMFPAAASARIAHRWGGVLGVPRDWMPSVGYDASRGLAWAGGYVGDGVGCAALGGRTLAELIGGQVTERTSLPWVGAGGREWEREPLRWLGIRGVTAVMGSADRVERRTGREARRAALVDRLVGH